MAAPKPPVRPPAGKQPPAVQNALQMLLGIAHALHGQAPATVKPTRPRLSMVGLPLLGIAHALTVKPTRPTMMDAKPPTPMGTPSFRQSIGAPLLPNGPASALQTRPRLSMVGLPRVPGRYLGRGANTLIQSSRPFLVTDRFQQANLAKNERQDAKLLAARKQLMDTLARQSHNIGAPAPKLQPVTGGTADQQVANPYLDQLRAQQENTQAARAQLLALGGGNTAQKAYGIAGRTVGDLYNSAVGLPAGLAYAVQHPIGAAEKIATSFKDSFEHPWRHPGLTLLNLLGIPGIIGGTVGRFGALGGALAEAPAADFASALGRLSKADSRAYDALNSGGDHLATIDKATAQRIAHPSPHMQDLLNKDPQLAANRSAVVDKLGKGDFHPRENTPGTVVREIGASKPAQVLKAAVKTPLPKQRTLTVPGENGQPLVVHPVGSKNAAANAFQRHVLDRWNQRRLDMNAPPSTSPVGRLASHVSAPAKVGRELRATRDVLDALELSPVSMLERFGKTRTARLAGAVTAGKVDKARLLGKPGVRLTAAEQKAVDIAATGRPVAEHVADHEQQIAWGVGNAADHRVQIALAKAAEPHLNLTKDQLNAVVENLARQQQLSRLIEEGKATAADHAEYKRIAVEHDQMLRQAGTPRVQAAIGETRALIRERERILGLSPDEVAHRVGARSAEIRAGAAGKESPLQELHRLETGLAAEGSKAPKNLRAATEKAHRKLVENLAAQDAVRPRTRPEAEARLTKLNDWYEKAINKIAPRFMEGDRGETARRNILRAKYDRQQTGLNRAGKPSGASSRKVQQRPTTLLRDARERAAAELDKQIAAHPHDPAFQKTAGLLKERAALQKTLADTHPVFGDKAAGGEPVLGTTPNPPLNLAPWRHEESQLRTRIDQLGRHARVQEIHQALTDEGHLAIERGAFYLPAKKLGELRKVNPARIGSSPFGVNLKGAKLPGFKRGKTGDLVASHEYTGALHRTGNFRTDATGLAAVAYRQAQRYASIDRGLKQLASAAKKTEQEAGGRRYAVAVFITAKVAQAWKDEILRADRGDLTKSELRNLDPQAVKTLIDEVFPDPTRARNGEIPGVQWIDGRLLARLQRDQSSWGGAEGFGKFADMVNAPYRASLLYTKPAYALNFLQNLGTAAIQQGVFTPLNMTRALRLGKQMGAEDQHALFALVDEGLSRSLEPGSGVGKTMIHEAGSVWNVLVDRYPRVASLLHEMRREGFNTPGKIHALLHDDRLQTKLVEITRRANKEAIDYGGLTPFERSVVKRAIFFYPWLRGATIYSLRFPVEHPIQAVIYGHTGQVGKARSDKQLGRRPSYLDGAFPFGGGLANPSNVNTFETPAQLGQTIAGLFSARSAHAGDLAQNLGPLASFLYSLYSGKTTLGQKLPAGSGRIEGALKEMGQSEPLVRLVQGVAGTPKQQSSNPAKQPIYTPGTRNTLGRYIAGGLFPASFNKAAMNSKGEAEYVSTLDPRQKVDYKAGQAYRQAVSDAKALNKAGALPAAQVPKEVTAAMQLDRARKLAYLDAEKAANAHHGELRPAQKADATLKVLTAGKRITTAQAANIRRVLNEAAAYDAKNGTKKQTTLLAEAWQTYGSGQWLGHWKALVTRHLTKKP